MPGNSMFRSRLRDSVKAGSFPGWRILGWMVANTLLRLWKFTAVGVAGKGFG
jgi:hypothetical protein